MELLSSIADNTLPHRGWMAFMGIIGIIAGAYLVIAPYNVTVIVWVAGIFMLVYGVMGIASAFALKKAGGEMVQA